MHDPSALQQEWEKHLYHGECLGCGKTQFTLPRRRGAAHAAFCQACGEVTLVRCGLDGSLDAAALGRAADPAASLPAGPPQEVPAPKEVRGFDWQTLLLEVDCFKCGVSVFSTPYEAGVSHRFSCQACGAITGLRILGDGSVIMLPLPASSPSSHVLAEALQIPLVTATTVWGLALTAGMGREITNSIGMKLRLIGPGEFQMGFEGGADAERIVHPVKLTRPFFLGVHPVTQAQFEKVLGGNPSRFKGPNRPVEQVGWNDALEFCKFLSQAEGRTYRLPTEAEWEYACRAGSQTEYFWGAEIRDEFCWYRDNSENQTRDVGLRKPNAWGLYDMSGNVWEWCQDRYAEFTPDAQVDPVGPRAGEYRVIRGGSWNHFPMHCRSSYRNRNDPKLRTNFLGFRVVLDPAPSTP